MTLHNADGNIFSNAIRAAAGHLQINPDFIEKDYWITLVLNRLSKSTYVNKAVFKGGTSLSKGYGLINRFSEDIDIAIVNTEDKTGNTVRTIIRTIEKEITSELIEENMEGQTSKGSKFRKSVFKYPVTNKENKNNRLIVEINSFASTFPHQQCIIKSFIYNFFAETNNSEYIKQYELLPFKINVLNKQQTLLEKLVSLIRFSYSQNAVQGISSKIRHFYDLYYLLNDSECKNFIETNDFKNRFLEILEHDKKIFAEPENWHSKVLDGSPLISDFPNIWKQLKSTYTSELSALAFTEIPPEGEISGSFSTLLELIK